MDDKQVSSSQPDLLQTLAPRAPFYRRGPTPYLPHGIHLGPRFFLFYHQPPAHWTEAMGLCSTGYVGV